MGSMVLGGRDENAGCEVGDDEVVNPNFIVVHQPIYRTFHDLNSTRLQKLLQDHTVQLENDGLYTSFYVADSHLEGMVQKCGCKTLSDTRSSQTISLSFVGGGGASITRMNLWKY